MADHVYHEVASHMSGSDHKPAKEIDHIKSYKSKTSGDTIHEHHHTHPEHHPMEKHTKRGDDEMAAHMMANLGTPNPGETADTGPAGPATPPDAAAGAAAGAAPNAAAGAPPAAAL
jgi:hypothetical protein